MGKLIRILIVIFLWTLKTFGQIGGVDHLLPAPRFIEGANSDKGYYGKVFKLLHSDFNKEWNMSYTVIPAFSSEYAFSIEQTNDSSYILVFNSLSENYWYSNNKANVLVCQKLISINAQTAELVIDLFRKSIALCEEYEPKNDEITLIGLDGAHYYFSEMNQKKIKHVGTTWSPRTYKMAEFVSICESLIDIDIDKTKELNNRIEKLITEFEQ